MANAKTTVINMRTQPVEMQKALDSNCFERIDRATKWGNPFLIGRDGPRWEVIEKYKIWVKGRPGLMAQLYQLKGKVLGCWCVESIDHVRKNKQCHGEILLELIEARK